jgi:peptidoglycan/xylan/chitin deacetylase (PgdA/CDA1 family)
MNTAGLFRRSLDAMFFTGASRALAPLFQGIGAILTLHHVRPGGGLQPGFAPNRSLEITPDYLDAILGYIRARGYEVVSLEAAAAIVRSGQKRRRPFIVFTVDDAYRDVFIHAWPIFRRHQCPFTLFVAPAIAEGTCELWWIGLEALIAGSSHLVVSFPDRTVECTTVTDAQKQAAWRKLYGPFRALDETVQRRLIRDLCAEHGIDLGAICRASAMGWGELRTIAKDPLCAIGAHTVHHYALAKLSPEDALREVVASLDAIERELGQRPKLFSYPYGDRRSAGPREFDIVRQAGIAAAVTGRRGLIFPAHARAMTALPRVSISGHYQQLRYLEVLLSGTAYAVWNGFRRVQAA